MRIRAYCRGIWIIWAPKVAREDIEEIAQQSKDLDALVRAPGVVGDRINDKKRICFHWKDGDAYDVEIVDYH